MKKFLWTLLIIIILAAAGLFAGWAQRGVPADSVAILRSKTHGVDPQLVKPGEFRWIWYRLIPANVKTAVFRLKPVQHNFSAKNTLPSAAVYSAFAGVDADFSWEISGTVSFNINPDALVSLAALNNIGTQEELAAYEKSLAAEIEAAVLRLVNSGGEYVAETEALLKNGKSPELEQEILKWFPQTVNIAVSVQKAKLPDYSLYTMAKDLFEEYIVLQKTQLTAGLDEKTQRKAESRLRLNELELYGELLTKYPILTEYLELEARER